jgi:hypothetical protein
MVLVVFFFFVIEWCVRVVCVCVAEDKCFGGRYYHGNVVRLIVCYTLNFIPNILGYYFVAYAMRGSVVYK